MALIPGAALAQFVGTRLAARALAAVGNVGMWVWGPKGVSAGGREEQSHITADNSLGLLGIDSGPDVDSEHAA